MAILRSSATCAMTFLVQTQNETSTAVAFFDKTVSACAQCILELGDAETNSAITQQLLHLPARMGGLGLTSQTAVASAAHTAATTTISHRQALQQIHVAAHANLVTSLSGPEVSVLTSNGDSWIADTQALTMSDKAATTMCRMRLLLDVRQGLCRCQRRTAATNLNSHPNSKP